MSGTVTLFLGDEAATKRLGEDLALALKTGDCVALSGDLGAGKSTLARAFLRAIADDDALDVPSPTFTLVQSYELRIPVFHFDLYRLGDESELDELGFDEAISQGICLIEWPEKAGSNLPHDTLQLAFSHEGEGRRLTISGAGTSLSRVRRTLAIRAFLDAHGEDDAHRRHLSGDASARAYERIIAPSTPERILMDSATQPPGPILQDGKYYQQLAHIAETTLPFVAIARDLTDKGFCAPIVHAHDFEQGLLLIEHLGSEGILSADGVPIEERYLESARLLAHLHAKPVTRTIRLSDSLSYTVPDFDRTAMIIETSLLIDWYLPWKRGEKASQAERDSYVAVWNGLIDTLADGETNLLLRDYHSPNILWREDRSGLDRIGIIDFQDAMIGPTAYDVASLSQDARVTIPPDLTASILSLYTEERARLESFNETLFLRDWHLMSAQRNCKLAGIWVRLMQRDKKPGYMVHMPRTFSYLETALAHPALTPLRQWCLAAGLLSN